MAYASSPPAVVAADHRRCDGSALGHRACAAATSAVVQDHGHIWIVLYFIARVWRNDQNENATAADVGVEVSSEHGQRARPELGFHAHRRTKGKRACPDEFYYNNHHSGVS